MPRLFGLVLASLLAVRAAASPPAACRLPLPAGSGALETAPFSLFARAALRSVDEKTLRAATHAKDGDTYVSDCRGGEMVTGWADSRPAREAGQLVEGGRHKLGDGRVAVWIESGADLGAPATLLHGFLAIARSDGASLIIDSIGPWENGEDAKRELRRQKIGSGPIFVEPTGHTGTGGGTDSTGLAVWVEKKGRLVRAGSFETEGLDENLGTSGPHWRLQWKSTVSYEDSAHVSEKQTWTLVGGKRAEVAKIPVERYFVVDGTQLNEVPAASERKPPHPADAVSKRVTVSAQAGNGELRLTFETALIPEEMVKQVVDLAPEAGPDGITVVVGAVNLDEGRRVVQSLQTRVVPFELEPIKAWMLRSAAFTLELQERKLAYGKSGDLGLLKRFVADVDPSVACAPTLAKLSAADPPARKQLMDFEWHNCVNNAFSDKRGEYPKAAWKQFLATYGIKSKFIAADGD